MYITYAAYGFLNGKAFRNMYSHVFENFEKNKKVIDALVDTSTDSVGVFTDWFLFAPNCLRIVPPLVITEEEITIACTTIIKTLQTL